MTHFLRVLSLMRPYRAMMALAIVLALTSTLANIGLMAVSGWFIAAMGLAGAASATINYFTPAAIIRALAIIRTAGRYAERVFSHEATFRVLAGLKRWFYDRVEPLAPARLAEHASGDLLARIRNDIERLELIFLRILSPVIVALFTAIIVVAVIATYHGGAALAVFALLAAAGAALPAWAARRGTTPSQNLTATSAEMKEKLIDGLGGLAELKLAGLDNAFAERIAHLTERAVADERTLARLQGLSTAGTNFAANFALLAVLVFVIPSVGSGQVAPAELPMLMLLAMSSFDALAPLPLAFLSLSGALASARRLFDLADTKPAIAEPEKPERAPGDNDLHLSNVVFRYTSDAAAVLKGFDLDVEAGRHVAIVGESGAGKSTLINLAVRFWDPDSGKITLGGTEISRLSLEDLRNRIAVAPQRPHLFAATIRDNLLIARPDASEGLIESAARTAGIHDAILELPKAYDTFVGNQGHLLSGGEARRIAVARALLKDAPILMLDEPTEGLDAAASKRLLSNIVDAAREKTMLLITHRPVGLALMDEVVVLQSGRVTARGHYRDLSRPGAPLHELTSLIDDGHQSEV